MNQSGQYYATNRQINATSSENNAQNNNQQSFEDQIKEFLNCLEDSLTKQSQNFLNVIHRENQTLLNTITNVIHREYQSHNEKIKQIIVQTIKTKLKNTNSAEKVRDRSHLTSIFGQKRREPLDSKRFKKNE